MTSRPLAVPFESQLDNASGAGWRECFSSSCAMVAAFWGRIEGDDAYCRLRARHGDTTTVDAQLATLRELGLRASFWQTGRPEDLIRVLSAGRPVPVGWLHKGPVTAPTGGHWSVVIGADREGFWMHDPYGEPLLVSGGHIKGSIGRSVRCGWFNFSRRWMVEGPGSGWWIDVSPA